MKTPCCIESVNKCPNTSSCSMILRSACSHGHSHKSLARNEVQTQNSERKSLFVRKSTDDSVLKVSDSKRSFQFESFLESSIKQIALKSTKTFSVWKENLYNHLEFPDSQKNEVFEQNGKNLKCISDHQFIKTSTPISSLIVNDNFISTTELVGNARSSERIENSIATMSGRRILQRNPLRALSGSDTDEESSYSDNRVSRRTRASNSTSHNNNSSFERFKATEGSATRYRSNNHVNFNNNFASTAINSAFSQEDAFKYDSSTPIDGLVVNQRTFSANSSQLDVSTVHESALDRLRWIVWRYIYLKMISIISFDVWLLSRLRGSRIALLILLLPLLLYIIYSTMIQNDELLHNTCNLPSSSLSSFISSFFSLLAKPFTFSQKLFEESKKDYFSMPSLLPSFSVISGYFSSLFVKTEERTYFIQRTSTSAKEQSSAPIVESLSKEQVESLAVKVLEERLNDLVQKIQVSNIQDLQEVKGETALLQKEISDLRHEFKSLSTQLHQLQSDVQKLETSSTKDVENLSTEHKMNINLLNTKVKAFEEKLDVLGAVKKCCDEKMNPADFIASIEKHLVAAFRSVVDGDKNSSYHFFSEWLNSKFLDPNALSSEIHHIFERLKKEQSVEAKQDTSQLKIIEGVVRHYMDSLKANMTLSSSSHQGLLRGSLSSEDVSRIVREAILLYDADKTGMVDYALESAGGSVLSTRCSESYTEKKSTLSLLGLPLWSVQNTPRTAIQPDVQPGQCWSFKGSQGFLVIQLSYTIHPTGFTLEHIPVSLSPTGSIDSAPKDFSVWGLSSEADNEGTVLGKYSYDDKGEPLQYFAVQNLTKEPFSYVELKIHNNHGHVEYTCLYRFRVHGTRVK